MRICQYFRVLKETVGEGSKDDTIDHSMWDLHHPDNIEYIVTNLSSLFHVIMWPGLLQSTLLYTLYVFDMSLDMVQPDIQVSLTLACLTLVSIPASMYLYYNRRSNLSSAIRNIRDGNFESSHEVTEIQDATAFTVGNALDVELRDSVSVKNPIFEEKDFGQ